MSPTQADRHQISEYVLRGDDLRGLGREWILTNGLGSFAMGSVPMISARRYHALLVAALRPPVERMVALSAVDDRVVIGHTEHRLSLFRFRDDPDPPNHHPHLVEFQRGLGCRWRYDLPCAGETVAVERWVWLYREQNAVCVRYTVGPSTQPVRVELTPLVGLRDFHELKETIEPTAFDARQSDAGLVLANHDCGVLICTDAEFHAERRTWSGLQYSIETERGFEDEEQLFAPGAFVATFGASDRPRSVELRVSTDMVDPGSADEDSMRERERLDALIGRTTATVLGGARESEHADTVSTLAAATDAFVVKRRGATSVIAGYPWFADWGRDTMIALPGLLLLTGRHAEAGDVLEMFAKRQRNGLIPNRFDDGTDRPHYNSVDASLWFIHAACEHARVTGDGELFDDALAPACLEVVRAYREGADFGIGMDDDGLIFAGDQTTQLTWMDARRNGVVFTPRHGKAVEVNALWHHGLVLLGRTVGDSSLIELAGRVASAFLPAFWWDERGCLRDVLTPMGAGKWRASAQIRPNQIFAASLEHSPLDREHRRRVVGVVRDRLLTPMGLRTLDPADPSYIARFEGDMMARDRAYHNGTVWPWLIGAYVEGLLRAESFSEDARSEARGVLAPLIDQLAGPYPGAIAEVFDGDEPRRPGGCIAQAWSVAEVFRAFVLSIG